MRPVSWTIKVVTDGPVAADSLTDPLRAITGVKSAEVTTFKVLPAEEKK